MATIVPYITAKYVSKHAKCAVIANGADELFFGYDRINSPNQLKHLFRYDFLDYDHFTLSDERFDYSSNSRWLELQTFVQYDLNQTLDQASMCHGLEVRSPFLDYRLVEMALSISDTEHLKEFGNKSILKRKLHSSGFSSNFTDRQKLGFSLFSEPLGYQRLKEESYQWCIKEGIIKDFKLTGRDKAYTMAAAASFYLWHKEYIQ